MIADGHEVVIGTKHHLGGQIEVNGITVFDGREVGLVNKIVQEEGYDYVISCMDHWTLPEPFVNWVAVNLLDCELIYPKMIQVLRNSKYQVAITKHGQRELERTGFKPFYCPLGVDTNLFKPDLEVRKSCRERFGWDDNTFVIGLVGINYPTDRKNIINTLRAFQGFHKRHPNSVLYLHTDVMGSATGGIPMLWVIGSCGFGDDNSITSAVRWVDQKRYHLWNISLAELAQVYNAFDVMCLASCGEGFGMPWLEAQACGVPVISMDTTSGKELNFNRRLVIPAHEDDYQYTSLLSWYVRADPSAIEKRLEIAFKAWEDGSIEKLRYRARKGALQYDWDDTYAKFWRPMLEALERGNIAIKDIPDYGTVHYENFTGRILMIDCAKVCGHPEICDVNFPPLPGEWEGPRSILSRSYPIVPDKDGELWVTTRCPLHKWMSPRFVGECEKAWKDLLTYPVIRRAIAELWGSDYFLTWGEETEWVDPECITHEFDQGYREAMQTHYWTTFQITDRTLSHIPENGKVLVVGCGDGNRVRELRERGYDALGCEVNPAWVDGDLMIFGNAEALPFGNDNFDAVFCIDVLEHLEHPRTAIAELFRVTRDSVVVQITPVEDRTFREDPTHKVPWNIERWKRELSEFGELTQALPGCGFTLRKREVQILRVGGD